MSFPAVQSVVVRGALQNVSIGYRNPEFIADMIYPTIDGLNLQTKVVKFAKWSWFNSGDDIFRSENSVAKRYDMQLSTQNLDPREIANGNVVSDELRRASAMPGNLPFNPEQSAVLNISDRLDRARELMVANSIFGATWADGTSGGSAPSGGAGAWALDTTGNSFIFDIENAKTTVAKATGLLPNALWMDYQTMKTLKTKATATGGLVERMKYTNPLMTDEALIAAVCGLKEVHVGKAIYTTEKETAAHSMSVPKWVWNQDNKGHCMVYYKSPTGPGLMTAFPGYQYRVAYDGGVYREIRSYREEAEKHWVYEASENVDVAPMCLDVACLFKTCISS